VVITPKSSKDKDADTKLAITMTAKTYRYLEEDEIAENQ
jgi:hypothetical protein